MQISADQGQFMALRVQSIGARRCLEIGTFTGYSSLAVALALPADGRVICCDLGEERTADTRAIRALNDKLQRDERVSVSLLAVGDGLFLAHKLQSGART